MEKIDRLSEEWTIVLANVLSWDRTGSITGMSDLDPWLRLTLAVLATWRITHLLAREDGPWNVLVRLRTRLGYGFLATLMDCFYCLSIWVAAPIALVISRQPVDWLLAWLGLSGAACLLERLGEKPVMMQPVAENKENDYELLRSTQESTEESPAHAEPADSNSPERADVRESTGVRRHEPAAGRDPPSPGTTPA